MMRLFVVVIAAALAAQSAMALGGDLKLKRSKRNVLNFGLMTKCATNKNPMDYNQYGCHCGKGGAGSPVDAVDTCCLRHDQCWANAKRTLGCKSSGHFSVYTWRCVDNRPLDCARNEDPCGRAYCDCDAEAAVCFARHEYSEYYRNWNGACRRMNPVPDWYNEGVAGHTAPAGLQTQQITRYLDGFLSQIVRAMQRIPASFIPHLGGGGGGQGAAPAAGAGAAAAAAAVPAAGQGVGKQRSATAAGGPKDPVMISLPGTGPDAAGNPVAGRVPATNPPRPGAAQPGPADPVLSQPAQAPRRPTAGRTTSRFSLPNIIGKLIGSVPWTRIFGKK